MGTRNAIVDLEITGITPLMTARMAEEDLLTLPPFGGPKKAHKGEPMTPADIAKSRVYVNEKGEPVMPVTNIGAWLIDGGLFVKQGKRQLSTRDTSMVPGMITILSGDSKIISQNGWEVDIRKGVNQSSKVAIAVVRPRWDDWKLKIQLQVNLDLCDLLTARKVVDAACDLCGIGAYRIRNRGWFGKAQVTLWKVSMPVDMCATKQIDSNGSVRGKGSNKTSRKKIVHTV